MLRIASASGFVVGLVVWAGLCWWLAVVRVVLSGVLVVAAEGVGRLQQRF